MDIRTEKTEKKRECDMTNLTLIFYFNFILFYILDNFIYLDKIGI